MNRMTTYLDLDRTLYKTDSAGAAKWRVICQAYPQVNNQAEYDRQQEFYVYSGDTYAYNFTAHVRSLGLNSAEVYDVIRRSDIADGRLEHEGVTELVSYAQSRGDVKVLTYGFDDYQNLKAALCPSIRGIEVITTLLPKGEYLHDVQNAWMVDDKAIGDELPSGVRFIQACLEGQSYTDAAWPVATALPQVVTLMQTDNIK